MKKMKNILIFVFSATFLTIFAVFCGDNGKTPTDTEIGFQRIDGEKTKEPTSFTWISNSKNNPVTIYVAKGKDNPAAISISAFEYPAGIEVHADECGTVSPDSTCTLYFDVDTTLVGQSQTFTIKGSNTNDLSITVIISKNAIMFDPDIQSINLTPGTTQQLLLKNLNNASIPNIRPEFTLNGAPTDCFSTVNLCSTIPANGGCSFGITAKSECKPEGSSSYTVTITGAGIDSITKPLVIYDTLFKYTFEENLNNVVVNQYPKNSRPQDDYLAAPTKNVDVYYYGKYLIKVTNPTESSQTNITGLTVTPNENISLIADWSLSENLCSTSTNPLNVGESCYIYFEINAQNPSGDITITTDNAQRDLKISFKKNRITLTQTPTGGNHNITKNTQTPFVISNETGVAIPLSNMSISSAPTGWTFASDPAAQCLNKVLNPSKDSNSCGINITATGNDSASLNIEELPTTTIDFTAWNLNPVQNALVFSSPPLNSRTKLEINDTKAIVRDFKQTTTPNQISVQLKARTIQGDSTIQITESSFSAPDPGAETADCITLATGNDSTCLNTPSPLSSANATCDLVFNLLNAPKCINQSLEYRINSDTANSLSVTFNTSNENYYYLSECDATAIPQTLNLPQGDHTFALHSCSKDNWIVDLEDATTGPTSDLINVKNFGAKDGSTTINGDHCVCPKNCNNLQDCPTDWPKKCEPDACSVATNGVLNLKMSPTNNAESSGTLSIPLVLFDDNSVKTTATIPFKIEGKKLTANFAQQIKTQGPKQGRLVLTNVSDTKLTLTNIEFTTNNPSSCQVSLDENQNDWGCDPNTECQPLSVSANIEKTGIYECSITEIKVTLNDGSVYTIQNDDIMNGSILFPEITHTTWNSNLNLDQEYTFTINSESAVLPNLENIRISLDPSCDDCFLRTDQPPDYFNSITLSELAANASYSVPFKPQFVWNVSGEKVTKIKIKADYIQDIEIPITLETIDMSWNSYEDKNNTVDKFINYPNYYACLNSHDKWIRIKPIGTRRLFMKMLWEPSRCYGDFELTPPKSGNCDDTGNDKDPGPCQYSTLDPTYMFTNQEIRQPMTKCNRSIYGMNCVSYLQKYPSEGEWFQLNNTQDTGAFGVDMRGDGPKKKGGFCNIHITVLCRNCKYFGYSFHITEINGDTLFYSWCNDKMNVSLENAAKCYPQPNIQTWGPC